MRRFVRTSWRLLTCFLSQDIEDAKAKLKPETWAPFDRIDSSLLLDLAVERKFKDHYLNRLVERFDIWLDDEDPELDPDVYEIMAYHRPAWKGGLTVPAIAGWEEDEEESTCCVI